MKFSKRYLIILLLALSLKGSSKQISRNTTPQTDSFGKKHFIVGFPHSQPKRSSKRKRHRQKVKTIVFFSPDDGLDKQLLKFIENEKKSIKIAIFSFTDGTIAKSLIAAHKRGVMVEVVTDISTINDKYSKVSFLKQHGIPIFVYKPKKANGFLSNIMHNKFVIFGRNDDHKSLLWTGSFNFTKSAGKRNQENVIVLQDKKTIKKYNKQFSCLKGRCAKLREVSKISLAERNNETNKEKKLSPKVS